MTLGDRLLCMREVCCGRKNVCQCGHTRILTDSARKKNMKEIFKQRFILMF